jgi:hypothetical protein
MSLLENPTNYSLSERKFSLGVAIFRADKLDFLDAKITQKILFTKTKSSRMLDDNYDSNDNYVCNSTNGDFDEISLDSSNGLFKQGHLIN